MNIENPDLLLEAAKTVAKLDNVNARLGDLSIGEAVRAGYEQAEEHLNTKIDNIVANPEFETQAISVWDELVKQDPDYTKMLEDLNELRELYADGMIVSQSFRGSLSVSRGVVRSSGDFSTSKNTPYNDPKQKTQKYLRD